MTRRPAFAFALVVAVAVAAPVARAGELPPGAPGVAASEPPDTVIVRYARDADAGERLAARRAADVLRDGGLPVPGLEVVDPKPGVSVDDAVGALERSDDVLYAEPNSPRRAEASPDDPLYSLQWSLEDIGAPAAWDVATGGSPPAPVAVIDTGIDPAHPDLAQSLWTNPGEVPGNGTDDDGDGYVDDVHGWDFVAHDAQPLDGNGHGTHVAGIIGARGNDGFGVSGVAWRSALIPLRVLDADGRGWSSDTVAADTYAARAGARVVNLSLSGNEFSQAEYDAIAAAPRVLFVAAAGNEGADDDATPRYPCAYDLPNVVCVAAIDDNDALAAYSNYGETTVDLAAPGTGVVSTWPGGTHVLLSGTSMATPHVAGAAALALDANPSLTPAELANALRETAQPADGLARRTAGGGRLDLGRLLARVAPSGAGRAAQGARSRRRRRRRRSSSSRERPPAPPGRATGRRPASRSARSDRAPCAPSPAGSCACVRAARRPAGCASRCGSTQAPPGGCTSARSWPRRAAGSAPPGR